MLIKNRHFLIINRSFNIIKQYHHDWKLIKDIKNFNLNYLCNPNNAKIIAENIASRKGVGDIALVNELYNKLQSLNKTDENYNKIYEELYKQLHQIPNNSHSALKALKNDPKLIKLVGDKIKFDFPHKEFHEISKRLNLARTEQLGNVSGNKSYFILGELADLEQSLVNYFVDRLFEKDFRLVSVPDILPRDLVEACGMNTRGSRNQVYTLDKDLHGPDLCLSGTSEIALAGLLMNQTLPEADLPLKLMAVSRCYRAETSATAEERGIYRVHEFTKVEMFLASTPDQSDEALEQIRQLEEENFSNLGLHFQVLDMPAHELGAQAYRKYDIEAWLNGRGIYGEISSCSNCTDYQSRRLGIKYQTKNGEIDFVHTLNGTAGAIPRLLIALVEQYQNKDGTITIPEVLRSYMDGKVVIGRQKTVPELRLIKNKR